MQQKTSPWESMPEMRNILVMEMREGKIYPTLVLEGGFIFGKHMNLQWVCGQSLSAFPYPQTTSSQGWIPREILAALWHVIGKFLKLGNFFLILMGIFVLVAGLWTAPQTDSDCIEKKICLVCNFLYSGFRTKRFLTAFAHFQHLVFEIVGSIAPLSLILMVIMWRKKRGVKLFSTDKWFKSYD